MPSRLLRTCFAIAVTCLAAPALAQEAAQDFPSRTIDIIVPFPPGSSVDATGRLIAEGLRKKWGQTVIVDNKVGATGNIATAYVARAKPDGYTLLFAPPGPLAINGSLYRNLSFDPSKLAPISIVTKSPSALVVNADLPVKTVQELVAYGKAHPGKLNFASSGAGGTAHLASALFASIAGIDMVHVPYSGSGAALNSVAAGDTHMIMSEIGVLQPYIKGGKVRVLAVGSTERNPALPDVPALAELFPGYVSVSWQGFVAPPGTPAPIIGKLADAINDIMRSQQMRDYLGNMSVQPVVSTPVEMASFVKEERERWAAVIKAAGAQVN